MRRSFHHATSCVRRSKSGQRTTPPLPVGSIRDLAPVTASTSCGVVPMQWTMVRLLVDVGSRATPVSPESFVELWLDQNVGAGPPLDKYSAEALELARELTRDALHAGYSLDDLVGTESLAHMVADMRRRLTSPGLRGASPLAAPTSDGAQCQGPAQKSIGAARITGGPNQPNVGSRSYCPNPVGSGRPSSGQDRPRPSMGQPRSSRELPCPKSGHPSPALLSGHRRGRFRAFPCRD